VKANDHQSNQKITNAHLVSHDTQSLMKAKSDTDLNTDSEAKLGTFDDAEFETKKLEDNPQALSQIIIEKSYIGLQKWNVHI
jgi:hypothetical protein